jgi:hypothetical protein
VNAANLAKMPGSGAAGPTAGGGEASVHSERMADSVRRGAESLVWPHGSLCEK